MTGPGRFLPLSALALLASLLAGGRPAAGGEIPITLDNAVRTAVERNLGLRVTTFDPAIAQTGILRAGAIYNPTLDALFDHRREDYRIVPDSPTVVRSKFFDADLSLNQLLSTGATASLAFNNPFFEDSLEGPASKFARPELSLSLSQPLLAGLGKEVTERGITVASDAKEGALAKWRDAALSVAASARDAYFSLIKAEEELATREASLAVARQVHAENEARVRAGVLASIELLDSEFGLAGRERDLLEAQKNVLEQADRLRVLIQYPDPGTLSPEASFPEGRVQASEEAATESALRMRPDLLGARISLKTYEFQAKVSRNLVLPSLAATGSAGVKGLSKNYGDAVDDLASADTPFWSVGLSFSYPLGNDSARADLAEATLRARQAKAKIRDLTESIGLDVRSAIRDMETKFREIEVAKKGVTLGEARLASFLKRGKLGLATTKNILEVEADYVAARDALTAARADYQGAVTRFYRSTGELLEQHGIRISDKEIETMTRKDLR
ncbi:MAG TPA: TolC family protein [Candidatus Deferrimicrobiaceae bacterium]|nr:TolC family protein [Candidatus Deferrimicrobiaceae bacterium]